MVKRWPQQVELTGSFQEGKANHFCQMLEMLSGF